MANLKPFIKSTFITGLLLFAACSNGKHLVTSPVSMAPIHASPAAPSTPAASAKLPYSDVYFEFDCSELSTASQEQLRKNAEWMAAHPAKKVLIEGHCDERGTNEYNMALGERRARSAKNYLTGIGVTSFRLRTISHGMERPLDSGHDEAAWAKNRRAHLAVE